MKKQNHEIKTQQKQTLIDFNHFINQRYNINNKLDNNIW